MTNTPKQLRFGIVIACALMWHSILPNGIDKAQAQHHVTFGSPTAIALKGVSAGGVMTLMQGPDTELPHVIITNKVGEAADSVIGRLARELEKCSVCVQHYAQGHSSPVVETRGSTIVLYTGGFPWIVGGTDTGFNIPAPPTSVSATYSAVTKGLIVDWTNPPGGYDEISILRCDTPWQLPGKTTHYVLPQEDLGFCLSTADIIVFVTGTRGGSPSVTGRQGGTPSNGAGVRLRNHVQQESLMNVPFTQGIAPSFQKWMYNTSASSMAFEQGNMPGMGPNIDKDFDGKGFYQVIKGQGMFCGGVSRRFLGLTPGHTYRVSSRLNTLDMKKKGNWGFSFHAAYDPATGESLTAAQMAGKVELPDKTIGSTAGQIARYDSNQTTEGTWIVRPGKSTGDITLPDKGTTSVTIWFRFEGIGVTNGLVGVDSVMIEDLGKRNSQKLSAP